MPIWIDGELVEPSPQPHILEAARLRALQLLASGAGAPARPGEVRGQAVWTETPPATRRVELADTSWSAIERGTRTS